MMLFFVFKGQKRPARDVMERIQASHEERGGPLPSI